jgi:uncharacterized oxidoreductase
VLDNEVIITGRNQAKLDAAKAATSRPPPTTSRSSPRRSISTLVEQLKANKGTIINVSSGLAFVPFTAAPIYSGTKAFMHAYTITLRQHGVEVIELMPPAVRTELVPYPEKPSFKVITTEELIAATFKALAKGRLEIRPGQANALRFMSRVAPGFIQAQLEKGSRDLIPNGST